MRLSFMTTLIMTVGSSLSWSGSFRYRNQGTAVRCIQCLTGYQSLNSRYKIIRHRVTWILGTWVTVKMSPQLRPSLYSVLVPLLARNEDLAVRMCSFPFSILLYNYAIFIIGSACSCRGNSSLCGWFWFCSWRFLTSKTEIVHWHSIVSEY